MSERQQFSNRSHDRSSFSSYQSFQPNSPVNNSQTRGLFSKNGSHQQLVNSKEPLSRISPLHQIKNKQHSPILGADKELNESFEIVDQGPFVENLIDSANKSKLKTAANQMLFCITLSDQHFASFNKHNRQTAGITQTSQIEHNLFQSTVEERSIPKAPCKTAEKYKIRSYAQKYQPANIEPILTQKNLTHSQVRIPFRKDKSKITDDDIPTSILIDSFNSGHQTEHSQEFKRKQYDFYCPSYQSYFTERGRKFWELNFEQISQKGFGQRRVSAQFSQKGLPELVHSSVVKINAKNENEGGIYAKLKLILGLALLIGVCTIIALFNEQLSSKIRML